MWSTGGEIHQAGPAKTGRHWQSLLMGRVVDVVQCRSTEVVSWVPASSSSRRNTPRAGWNRWNRRHLMDRVDLMDLMDLIDLIDLMGRVDLWDHRHDGQD